MEDVQLSRHFLLSEFTHSDTALRLGIDNTPPPEILEALRGTAGRMEVVRSILGHPIIVTSGFRCEALERAICEDAYAKWCRTHKLMPSPASWRTYFSRKQHPKGRAVDFRSPGFGTPLEICHELARHAEELAFDQLIYEFDAWVHIGWPEHAAQPRLEILTINARGTFRGLPEIAAS